MKIAAWPDVINLRFPDAPPIQVFHGAPNDPWESIHWTFTDEEIEKIRATAQLQDRAVRAAFDAIRPGMRDIEITAEAERLRRRNHA